MNYDYLGQTMKNNEIIRRLLLQFIAKNSTALVLEMLENVQADVGFELEENDIKASLKWLTRKGYIEAQQSSTTGGRFAACERTVLKFF